MAEISDKSRHFVENVCRALDEDRRLTLVEYAKDCGIERRYAYTLLMRAVGNDKKRYRNYLQRPNYVKPPMPAKPKNHMPNGIITTKEEEHTMRQITSAKLILFKKRGYTLERVATELGYSSEEEFLMYLNKTNIGKNARENFIAQFKANEKKQKKNKKPQNNAKVSKTGSNELGTEQNADSDVNSTTEIADENSICIEETKNMDTTEIANTAEPIGSKAEIESNTEKHSTTQRQKFDVKNANKTNTNDTNVEKSSEQLKKDNLEADKKLYTDYILSLREDVKAKTCKLVDACKADLSAIEFSWEAIELIDQLDDLKKEIKENSENLVRIVDELEGMKKIYIITESCDEQDFTECYGDIYHMAEVHSDELFTEIFHTIAMKEEADDLSLKEVKCIARIVAVMREVSKNKKEIVLIASEQEKALLAKFGY